MSDKHITLNISQTSSESSAAPLTSNSAKDTRQKSGYQFLFLPLYFYIIYALTFKFTISVIS